MEKVRKERKGKRSEKMGFKSMLNVVIKLCVYEYTYLLQTQSVLYEIATNVIWTSERINYSVRFSKQYGFVKPFSHLML
jgi:hypothetical protein